MSKLIEALNIFLKYGDPAYPFHCEHDILTVVGISPAEVSKEDRKKLSDLGFFVSGIDDEDEDDEDGEVNLDDCCFQSYKYGSA